MRLASALLAVVVSVGTLHAEPAKTQVTVVEDGSARRTAALWTLVGAGGLLATSVALSLHERSEYHDALARQDVSAANHAVMVTRYAGTGLFVAGGVALGVALYLRATAPEKHTIIAPAVAPDSVGAVLSGSF
jgi:hypothetical protein